MELIEPIYSGGVQLIVNRSAWNAEMVATHLDYNSFGLRLIWTITHLDYSTKITHLDYFIKITHLDYSTKITYLDYNSFGLRLIWTTFGLQL